jgi:glucose/arabinose dehydrogenase
MNFGPDNYLYISISDGSFNSANANTAQNGSLFSGKILRLDINNPLPPYYTIPSDNPFVNDSTVRPEIWALGARNFWRWSFDRLNGNMWLADNGADQWDEIDLRKRKKGGGANFGWPCYESNAVFDTSNCKPRNNFVFPIFTTSPKPSYNGQAIIGGYMYRGKRNPLLKGYYICSDYIAAEALLLTNNNGTYNVTTQTGIPEGITSYGEGEDGELYAASTGSGIVYKISAVAPVINLFLINRYC